MEKIVVQGTESWHIRTQAVDAHVTEHGGMMAPVVFTLDGGRTVRPYYVNPWAEEHLDDLAPPVLRYLRGDFYCLPFGGDNLVGTEDHEVHGESSFAPWLLESTVETRDETVLSLKLAYTKAQGTVRKILSVGNSAPYIRTEHQISGFSGSYPHGHHATLSGGKDEGIWKIYVKPFDFGMTDASSIAPSSGKEYYSLKSGVTFDNIESVPTRWADTPVTDTSLFPARDGFVDILALYRKVSTADAWKNRISWTVAVNRKENYVWYSLKDASVLPATVIWMENRGRHAAPWSGRNSCIGLEETCSYGATGRKPSIAKNPVSDRGIPTAHEFDPSKPTVIRTVQGVLPVDLKDSAIVSLDITDDGKGVFRTASGTAIPLPAMIDLGWLGRKS